MLNIVKNILLFWKKKVYLLMERATIHFLRGAHKNEEKSNCAFGCNIDVRYNFGWMRKQEF